jgi:hypothetical protein
MPLIRPTRFALALAAACLCAAGCDSKPAAPKPETFASSECGFSLTFPDDWAKWMGIPGSNLLLYAPDQTDPNAFRDNVLVRVEYLEGGLTLDEFFNLKVSKGAAVMPDYKELQRGNATIGGQPARRLVYSYSHGDTPVTSIAYFLLSGQRGYMVLCSASVDRFPQRKAQFEEIAGTFKLIPVAAEPAK